MYSTTNSGFLLLVTLFIASLAQTSNAVSIYKDLERQGQVDKRLLLQPIVNVEYEGQTEGNNGAASNIDIDLKQLLGL